MSSQADELATAFKQADWRTQPVGSAALLESFDGLFCGAYAICAVSVTRSSAEAVHEWPKMQGALAELKALEPEFREKDLYLLFIVEMIEEDGLGELQSVLDDARVCRKICLEKGERSLSETLEDIPFFSTPGTMPAGEEDSIDVVDALSGLPADVQYDLERRSPERILLKLIEGQYEAVR